MRGLRRRSSADRSNASADFGSALDLGRDCGAKGLRVTICWLIARSLFRIGFAGSLVLFVGYLIEDAIFDGTAIAGALICLVLTGCAGVLADVRAASTEQLVADRLRTAIRDALSGKQSALVRTRSAGALVAGLQRHPDALASLTVSHGAARSMLAIGPVLAAAAIAMVSWEAALTLLLAIPVMIAFFVMLGGVVGGKAEVQEKAFGRLAAQFTDRIRALPTILANHALQREHDKIDLRMSLYADSTMDVLKVAFLNAGIIDFFSAVAIAVLAIFLGLGHLGLAHIPGFSGLPLWQSLFILVVAAEFFMPFRRYAEQYHLKAEGQAAGKELEWYFLEPPATGLSPPAGSEAFDATQLPPAGLVAISGPSGSGKSTLLRMLAGIEAPSSDVEPLPSALAAGCDWISTDVYVPAASLGDAISWNREGYNDTGLQRAAGLVGLLDERSLPGGLNAAISEGGENLSGGQRMRIGIARILLSGGVVIADEPTAKLDPQTAEMVRQVLTEVAKKRLVIVATHDEQLIDRASWHHILRPEAERAVAA